MRNLFLYLILILLSSNLQAQKTVAKNKFDVIVKEEEGDLNNDKKNDKVIVEMDVVSDTRPLRLRVFLSQPNKKELQLAVSSTQIIESQYPTEKNGEHSEGTIPDFFIEDGNLQMLTDIRGFKSRYTFRFKNDSFELIKISRVIWDGKNTTSETEIDLLKGTKIEFDQELGSDEILNKRNTKKIIKPLPKITDLKFSDLEAF
ncbi:hypothetical protein [Epilithonimonas lactis]|uniref:Uncharacterized protein n=1 Tax=Epilithonimonas lactis TaxID=421072 RepID=A0A085B7H9_9FLAO|nr:hypothetical protein [Epilithonimonas lactis]KFC18424.1 hypothetical protein IO89_18200 [Epilithonimonas lactis]SER01639.1 hypothetical protein SAMN04488097_3662 [Epilithonimonas lactis]